MEIVLAPGWILRSARQAFHGDLTRQLLDAPDPGAHVGVGSQVDPPVAGQGHLGEHGDVGDGERVHAGTLGPSAMLLEAEGIPGEPRRIAGAMVLE